MTALINGINTSDTILASRLRSAPTFLLPVLWNTSCLIYETFALEEVNCFAGSLTNMRLPCSESPTYRRRKDTEDRCPVERARPKSTTVPNMWVKTWFWKRALTSGASWWCHLNQRQNTQSSSFGIPRPQSCEQHKLLFLATRFWGTLLCTNRYILKYTKNNQIIRGFLKNSLSEIIWNKNPIKEILVERKRWATFF